MKKLVEFLLVTILRIALWFRYRIHVKGLDKLKLNKSGGVLFLPNHPTVFVDATAITIALWPKYKLRPMIIEYMYYLPVVNWVMKLMDALPVPNFAVASNSLKRKKNAKIVQEVIEGLKIKQNFLIFPSGRTKQTAKEAIDGASAVHQIVQEVPESNVVLVRVKGLWGSSFSRALTGKAPPFYPTLMHGIKVTLKNLLFFNPRRDLYIEFEPAPADFPYKADKLDFNRYFERWYNQPDGLKPSDDPLPGDSLVLVSYSRWKEELPTLWQPSQTQQEFKVKNIPIEIQNKIIAKIVELTGVNPAAIKPESTLTTELGMDSLDTAEIVAFLQDQFDVVGVNAEELITVSQVMALAARQATTEEVAEEEEWDFSKWKEPSSHEHAKIAEGNTIHEVFLNSCSKMGNALACADMRSGMVTYKQLKMRSIILAEYIKTLPGEYVGILLPASIAASMAILACQIAGKVPLMINWTVGPRHLQAVSQLSNVKTVLSSWAFLDRLQNVDLTGIEDNLVMLEDVRRDIGITKKIKGLILSKLNTKTILKTFKSDKIKPEDKAVLLFTSGTESLPKGVPLSHYNILSNQRAALETIDLFKDDVIFGILPPFHSFGFTISSLFGLLCGVKIAYSPDPTDGKRLAKGMERWGITVLCGAPTFVKNILKSITQEQLRTLRLCVTGAEKMPPEIALAMFNFGKGDILLEGYGITECSPVLTFTRPGKPRQGVGEPLPGIELTIVDLEKHTPLPQGQQGLILARGPNVFSGYLNPGLASPFIKINDKQWYITGDLGYIDPQGNLILSGRLKRFVKVGGEMVSLAAIEEVLQHAAINKAWTKIQEEGPILAITAKEEAGEKPKISLYCTFPLTLDEANNTLKEAGFSNLIKITSINTIPEIPLMGSGKIYYRRLEEMNLK